MSDVHLMTIQMGAWCGATGPAAARASSAWAEVTCPDCRRLRVEALTCLVLDMLETMPPSRQALGFAVRAGRLGVAGHDGRALVPACMPGQPGAEAGDCGQLALIGYRIHGADGQPLGCSLTSDGHHWHYDRAEDVTWQRGTPEECQASMSCQLPGDCVNGPEPHPFIPPLPDVDLPCCRQPWEGRQPLTVAAVDPAAMTRLGELADAAQEADGDG